MEGLPSNMSVFLEYFIPAIILVVMMLNRTVLLKFLLTLIHYIFDPVRHFVMRTDRRILSLINKINNQEFVFFTKGDNIASLNQVMLYVTRNEHTKRVKIVLVLDKNEKVPKNLPQEIEFLDKEYPQIKVEFVVEQGKFSPSLIEKLSKKWDIPINFMFMGSPSDKFEHKIEDFGGVRIII